MINDLPFIRLPAQWLERNRTLILRLLVVSGVLLVSAYLGPRVSIRRLALLIGAGMALLFLRRPQVGLYAVIIGSLIVPFAIGTGTESSLNATVLLLSMLVGLWVLDMVRRRNVRLVASRPILPLVAFSLVAVLAFLSGNLPWFVFAQPAPLRAQVGGVAVFLLSAGAFLLVAHQVLELRSLERMTWMFLALGGLYIAGRILPGLGYVTSRLFQYGSTGSLFWIWLTSLSFSQAAFNEQLPRTQRLALAGLALATMFVALFQSRSWASGWLPPLLAVVAILWVGAPRLGALATLFGGVMILSQIQRAIGVLMMNEQYSVMTRWEAWKILAEIIAANPVLGLGPANYYYYTPLFPILGYYVRFNSHNQYVDIAAQTGLLGMLCFLWFTWQIVQLGWDLRGRWAGGFERAYVYGALGGLAGSLAAGLLGDWLIPFVYNVGLSGFRASALGWLFLGGLVSLEQLDNDRRRESEA